MSSFGRDLLDVAHSASLTSYLVRCKILNHSTMFLIDYLSICIALSFLKENKERKKMTYWLGWGLKDHHSRPQSR